MHPAMLEQLMQERSRGIESQLKNAGMATGVAQVKAPGRTGALALLRRLLRGPGVGQANRSSSTVTCVLEAGGPL